MPPTKTDPSQPTTGIPERSAFQEPSISAPLDLAGAQRGPMMAMVGGSAGGGAVDAGGFGFDGTAPGYLDGHADTGAGPGGVSDTLGAD